MKIENGVLIAVYEQDIVNETLTIPDEVSVIGDNAIRGYKNLTRVILPDTLKQIGNCAFYSCERLVYITIPYDVEIIGCEAFENCKSLIQITLPTKLKKIDFGAFRFCINLNDVTFNQELKEICARAFEGCKSLTSVLLPSSVENIGEGAFEFCDNISEITLNKNINKIGICAFCACEKLSKIKIPEGSLNVYNQLLKAYHGNNEQERIIEYYVSNEKVPDNMALVKIENSFFSRIRYFFSNIFHKTEKRLSK